MIVVTTTRADDGSESRVYRWDGDESAPVYVSRHLVDDGWFAKVCPELPWRLRRAQDRDTPHEYAFFRTTE